MVVTDQTYKKYRHMCIALPLMIVLLLVTEASASYDLSEPCKTGREEPCLHERRAKEEANEEAKEKDVKVTVIEEEAGHFVTLLAEEEENRELQNEPSTAPTTEWPVFLEHLLSDTPSAAPSRLPTARPTTASPAIEAKQNQGVDCDEEEGDDDRICDHLDYDIEKEVTVAPTDLTGRENASPSPASFEKDCIENPCPHDTDPEEVDATWEPTTTGFTAPSPGSPPSPPPTAPGSTPSPSIANELGIQLAPCEVDEDGLFGADSGEAETFDYLYEVEMNGLIGAGILDDIIEETLDDGLAEVAAAALFPDECSGSAAASATSRATSEGALRMLRKRRRLTVSGVSARPVDTVLEDLSSCSETPSPGNTCFVVGGQATIFSRDGEVDEPVREAQEAIRLALDGGAFNNVDNRLIAVTYRSSLEIEGKNSDGTTDPEGSNGSNNVPAYVWAVIAGAVVALIAGVFFLYQRSQRAEQRIMSSRSALSVFNDEDEQGAKEPEPHYYNEAAYEGFDSGHDNYDPSIGESTKEAFASSSGESGRNYQGAINMHGTAQGAGRSTHSFSTPSSGSRAGSVPQFRAPSDFQPDGSGDYPENRAYHEPEIPIEGENEDGSPLAEVQVSP